MMSVYSLARPATARPSDARACAAPHGGLTSLDERQRKGSAENICREHLDLVANHESKSLRVGRLERAGKGEFIHNCDTEMGENAPNTTPSCLQASRDGEAPSLALRLRRGAVAAAARLGTQTGTHSLWLLAAVPPKKSRDTPPHTHTQRWPTGWRRGSEEDALGSSLREEPTAGSCRVTQGSRNLHDETERSDPGRGQGATTPATGRGSCGHPVATGRGPPWAPPPALKRPSGPAAEAAHGRGRPGPLDRERGAGATPHPPTPQRCGGLGRAAARRGAAGNAGSRKQRVQVGKIESPGLSCPCSHRAPPSAGVGLQREPWEAAQGGLRAPRTCTSSSRSHGTAD